MRDANYLLREKLLDSESIVNLDTSVVQFNTEITVSIPTRVAATAPALPP
jgi:hypothetical protein